MSEINQCFGWPNVVNVICKQCDTKAELKHPEQVIEMVGPSTRPLTKVYTDTIKGRFSCLNCGLVKKENFKWPVDAFYSGEVKGHLIWAWDKQHAVALRDYISATDRDYRKYNYARALYHLPEVFKRSKKREACVKTLDKMIAKL